MKFGIDRLITEEDLRKPLEGKRVALVAHPASVTANLDHSLDALIERGVKVSSAFGPQHLHRYRGPRRGEAAMLQTGRGISGGSAAPSIHQD